MHTFKGHARKYAQYARLQKYMPCAAMKCSCYISPQDGLCVLDGMPEGRDLTFCDGVPMMALFSSKCSWKVFCTMSLRIREAVCSSRFGSGNQYVASNQVPDYPGCLCQNATLTALLFTKKMMKIENADSTIMIHHDI
jgi:hypothetical protein